MYPVISIRLQVGARTSKLLLFETVSFFSFLHKRFLEGLALLKILNCKISQDYQVNLTHRQGWKNLRSFSHIQRMVTLSRLSEAPNPKFSLFLLGIANWRSFFFFYTRLHCIQNVWFEQRGLTQKLVIKFAPFPNVWYKMCQTLEVWFGNSKYTTF